ncbi:MAG: sugar phosphate isomerase/epimerase family protein [Candidatus Caldatribacteriaceae bacterium]
MFQLAVGTWCMGGVADRFLPQGYEKPVDVKERILRIQKVKDIAAVEFFDDELEFITPQDLKVFLDDHNLKVSGINFNTHGRPQWQRGALSSPEDKLRREAINGVKRVIDLLEVFSCSSLGLWLGTDGFDYPFQIDYGKTWDSLCASLAEIADYNPSVRISLEYKLKEPRQYILLGNAFQTLYLIKTLGRKNIGVTVDFGHALMAKENPGEVVSILAREKVLYNVHFNDAYREWDDDLIAGSANLYETLEFLYYLKKVGYDGYIGFDIFPYRMDPVKALELCVENTRALERLLDKIDVKALENAQEHGDAALAHQVVRKVVLD